MIISLEISMKTPTRDLSYAYSVIALYALLFSSSLIISLLLPAFTEQYLGCYADDLDHALEYQVPQYPNTSIGDCIDACRGLEYTFAGLEVSDGTTP